MRNSGDDWGLQRLDLIDLTLMEVVFIIHTVM